MNKKIFFLFGSIVIFALAFLLILQYRIDHPSNGGNEKVQNSRISVVATFYPLYYFAQQVGGDIINLSSVAPSGVEPHDYEPTARDIIQIKTADVFLMNGAQLETWADKLVPQLQQDGVKLVKMSDQVELLNAHADTAEEIGQYDPHIWLDPVRAQQEVRAIRDAFITVDPIHRKEYEQNATNYLRSLAQLDVAYQEGLSSCATRETITSHNAFQYLAQRYHFISYSIAGFSPTEDPSPKHLATLAELVKEKNVHYIFTETFASPKFSNTLSQETGVKTLVLNPIEGVTPDQAKQGENYDTLMRENLANLRQAMGCK